jgi:two-component system response regulator
MTVLYVDDDQDDNELFVEVVREINSTGSLRPGEQIECLTVTDALKASELLNRLEKLPDLIFLDINMPIMDGREFLKILKAHPIFRTIPVLMFSTAFSDIDLKEFKILGVAGCVRKPCGFTDLIRVVKEAIAKKYS